jgi:AcrR family transcriptional regulator
MARPIGLAKTDVLAAAAEIVDEEGVDRLTVSRLAGRLGVRSQSLYFHIDGVVGLRRDLILHGLEVQARSLESAVRGKEGRDALLALMEELVRGYRDHPGVGRLIAWSQPDNSDDELFRALTVATDPLTNLLASYGLTEEDLAHWRRIIWTSLHGFVSLELAGRFTFPADSDSSLRLLMELFADGLERARRPQPA